MCKYPYQDSIQSENSNYQNSQKSWYEKEIDEWDDDDYYEALVDLYESHHKNL